jgi:hypothetical protein
MKPTLRGSLIFVLILAALILMPAESTWANQKSQTLPTAPPPRLATPTAIIEPAFNIDPEKLARWCKYLQENPYRGLRMMGYPHPYSWWRLSKLKVACHELYPDIDFDY